MTINKCTCTTRGKRHWFFKDELNLEPTLKKLMFESLNMRQTMVVVIKIGNLFTVCQILF